MARRVPWRRVCPDVVASRIDEAIQARIYLLRETGPTGFLLKEDGSDRKLKVCFRKFNYFYLNNCSQRTSSSNYISPFAFTKSEFL